MASPDLDTPMDGYSDQDLDDYDWDDSDNYYSDDSNDHLSGDRDNLASDEATVASNEYDSDSNPTQKEPPPEEDSDDLIAATEALSALCSQATSEISHLPRKTRNTLTSQTRAIFKSYEQHGSQLRLAIALEKFLLTPDDASLDYTPQSPPLVPKEKVTRTHDPDSSDLVRDSPFHAVDLELEISGDVTIPPYLLPSLDRIFGLYALEARALLKHHCEKYGDEPIFRAGIRAHVQSQLEGILESTGDDALGLTPENRAFLREVYERAAVLNVAEKRMLAMSTRLSVETVEMFWGDMDLKREAYVGMRTFVAARELEGMRAERAEAEWKRRRDEMLEAGREFGFNVGGPQGFGVGGKE